MQCLSGSEKIDLYMEFTPVEYFKDERNRRIYQAILCTYEEGMQPDLVEMFDVLPEQSRQSDIGGCMELICEQDRLDVEDEQKKNKDRA